MWKASKRPCPLRQLRRDVSRMRGGLQESSAEPVRAYLPCDRRQAATLCRLGVVLAGLGKLFEQHVPFQSGEVINRSEEHTSELQSLMRISYAVFCLKKKKNTITNTTKSTAYIV